MRRSTQVHAARFAAAALMSVAMIPVLTAGAVHADDTSVAAELPYAEQVAVGDAVKLGNPALARQAGSTTAATPVATPLVEETSQTPEDVSTITATPSGAVVIETESHQADAPEGDVAEPTDTAVAVLGTKVGANVDTLAETGPTSITPQLLAAFGLIAAGLLVRAAPALLRNDRRH